MIIGIGKVGAALARHLHEAGARLTLADVRTDAVAALATEFGRGRRRPRGEAVAVECDILSPCALGAVLDPAIDPARCVAPRSAAPPTTSSPPTPTASAWPRRGVLTSPTSSPTPAA